jgi:hypothetical protein
MKAAVGDRVVVVSSQVGGVVRDGVVVELKHEDGSPPYVVEWSDSGHRALYYPGTDGRVVHDEPSHNEPASVPGIPDVDTPHVATWNVTVQVFEQGPHTSARAVLHAGATTDLQGRGQAKRNPHDPDVPEIGDEVAVSRALHQLADSLMTAAHDDMKAAGSSTGR